MPRSSWNLTAKRTFSEAYDANVAETEEAVRRRRIEMNKSWDDLDAHSQALEKRMVEVGITKAAGSDEEMLRLNVGGAPVNIRRSALEGRGYLGRLLESVWDKRLPRDSDGFIVLDQSPTCVKYAIHTLLGASVGASGTAPLALGDGLPADEQSYLPFVTSALGLAEHLWISAVLEHGEFGPLSATILDWCPGKPCGLELVYRASRDGLAPEAFYEKCRDDSPSTVTLCRVKNTDQGTRDSVVGGFSSVPWTPGTRSCFRSSRGAFVCMLKDGSSCPQPTSFQPVKWDIKAECQGSELYCDSGIGPCFAEDLEISNASSSNPGLLATSNSAYRIPQGSPFLLLHGHKVVEMETFRVRYPETTASRPCPKPGIMDIPPFEGTATSAEEGSGDDIRSFGVCIAGSLTEEKMALHQGHNELAEANAKAAASVQALAAVYGPDVAAGKEDTVIELSVRGTRMTTLRSTLQACPDSALAARFDKDKWPATEKDLDDRGRRVMDCNASVFSKVLDLLRMRKRAAWLAAEGRADGDARVSVKPGDRAAFGAFVDMYFPGCEDFIMGCVADAGQEPATCS